MMTQEKSGRIYILDYLKAIAMIAVIFNHCILSSQVEKDLLFPYFIGLAVPCFILISGFTFSLSYKKYEKLGMRHWYKKETLLPKLSRFVMPFIPIFIIEVIFRLWYLDIPFDLYETIRSFFFGGYGPGGYYITIVVQLLLVFPFCYWLVRKWEFKGVIVLGIIQLIYQFFALQIDMEDIYYKRIFLRLLIFLGVGIYLYLHRENLLKSNRNKILLLLSFICGGVYIYFVNYLNIVPDIFQAWRRTAMPTVLYVFPAMAALICGFLYKKIPGKCSDLLSLIGASTYHILLVQMLWFYMKFELLMPWYLRIPVNIILTIAIGILFFQADTSLRKKWKNRQKKSIEKYVEN